MRQQLIFTLTIFAAMLATVATTNAQVRDNAKLFSQEAVSRANADIRDMQQRHNKTLVVETFPALDADQKAEMTKLGEKAYFDRLLEKQSSNVNGVYLLICMDPRKLEVHAGRETTSRGDFTASDRQTLFDAVKSPMSSKSYDQALGTAVDTVERAYTSNIGGAPARTRSNSAPVGSSSNGNSSNGNSPVPSGQSGGGGMPGVSGGSHWGLGTLVCLGIGAVIIFTLIKSVFRGQSGPGVGGNYGGNQPMGGQNYGQGYGQGGGGIFGGGGGGGGGGGFGRGILGGLLGGAIGGYAADKFEHRNDNSGGQSSQSNDAGVFGGGGGGGSNAGFDSGPSDVGQGFDSGGTTGGDFGGGGDSGGGGGDSGGSTGGDF